MPEKINRQQLAKAVTDTLFLFDPYNGFTETEVEAQTRKDLTTLQGCYTIIQELCNMVVESIEA